MFFVAGATSVQAARIYGRSGLWAAVLVDVLAGVSSVGIGCAIAPDRVRIAAPLIAVFSLTLAGFIIYVARLTNDHNMLFTDIVIFGLYSIAVLVTTAVFVFRRS
jgi:hypothetical protein